MIVSKTPLPISDETALYYLKPLEHALLFDIETTGLYWKSSHLYLIGAAFCESGQWFLQQWFLDRPAEESALLLAFSDICRGRSVLVHYNGTAFDLPYLQHKYTFYQLRSALNEAESLDLYRLVKPLQNFFGLTGAKQKETERFLGFSRRDRYSGGELIHTYEQYLQTREEDLLERLLLHNREDVLGLCHLLSVQGYPRALNGAFTVSSAAFSDQTLTLELRLADPVPRRVDVGDERYSLTLSGSGGRLFVYARRTVMKHFFPDYKNYYYLPEEDAAVHKSVGAYVDSAHRVRAKAATCYQKASGLFLPQYTQSRKPAFYEDYQSRPSYFMFRPELLEDGTFLLSYARELLSRLQ